MKNSLLILACVSMLSACGGGGGDGGEAGIDPIDRYIGTWSNVCDTLPIEDITELSGKGVSGIEVLKFEKTSSTHANFTYTMKVFADTECTGQPIATLVKTGLNNGAYDNSNATLTTGFGANTLTYLGPEKVGAETVDKVEIVDAKLRNTNVDTPVGGAIVKSGPFLFEPQTTQALFKFKSSTQILWNDIVDGVIPDAMEENQYLLLTKQ